MRALIACGLVVLAGACGWHGPGEPGERRETGRCPPRETCSEELPDGLFFEGARPVAVDGVRTITLWEDVPRGLSAVSSDDAVLSVEEVDWRSVRVRGVGDGTARLRILDPEGALVDRVEIRVATVEAAGPHPYPIESSTWTFYTVPDLPLPRGVAREVGELHVYPGLFAADGTRLVDDAVRWADPDASTAVPLTLPVTETGVSVELVAAGRTWSVELPVLEPDDIRVAATARTSSSFDIVCLTPHAGDRPLFSKPTVWRTTRLRGREPWWSFDQTGCVLAEEGRALYTVRSGEVTRRFDARLPPNGPAEVVAR